MLDKIKIKIRKTILLLSTILIFCSSNVDAAELTKQQITDIIKEFELLTTDITKQISYIEKYYSDNIKIILKNSSKKDSKESTIITKKDIISILERMDANFEGNTKIEIRDIKINKNKQSATIKYMQKDNIIIGERNVWIVSGCASKINNSKEKQNPVFSLINCNTTTKIQ